MALPLDLTTDALRDLLGGRLRIRTPAGKWAFLRDPRSAGDSDAVVLGGRVPLADRAATRAGLRIAGPADDDPRILEVEDPDAARDLLVRFLDRGTTDEWRSPEEVVSRFGELARFSRIHRTAILGEGTRIGGSVVVHQGVVIGERCVLSDHVVVGSQGFGLGPGASGPLEPLPHRAGVILENDVLVGVSCNIAAGLIEPTRIGAGSRLDALVQIGHNSVLGRRCVLAGQSGVAGSVELGDDCLVGGQAGISDHVRLAAGCRVAAKSGVTRSWETRVDLAGFPARPRADWNRDLAHSVPSRRTELADFPEIAKT